MAEPRPRPEPERIVIVGAGLAGCLLATLLGRDGAPVELYERRPDPRTTGAERGRSINLAVSARGLDALERVGLGEELMSRALPMHGRMIHPPSGGAQSFRPYSADGLRAINSVSRSELNHVLLDVADATPGVSLHFDHRLETVDLDAGVVAFDTPQGSRQVDADVVLAADGSYSAARRTVTFRQGFTFAQDYLEAGYKELTIPARDGEFALDPDALHIWPRGESMMIALPNLDRSFTCTLFWPKVDLAALRTPDEITGYFREHYGDVIDLMPTLVEDYQLNPVGSLVTITCWPWVHSGERAGLALVGDAAHAIVPFFGQGANCALEDCVEIARCLRESGGDWTRALVSYQERRKANCDAIAEMALDNFVEMRDRVNSPLFRASTATQHALERRLPGRYVSRYELVSFSTMPYAQILARIRKQNRAVAAAGVVSTAALVGAAALARRTARRGFARHAAGRVS